MRKSLPNTQMRALAMAMAGASVAAVATMFVPVGILESVAGSTGLSELVPAARAPLGDTARALIAFGAGSMTLAVLAYVLLRQDGSPAKQATASVPASEWALEDDDAPSFKDRLSRIKLPSVALPKMPWVKDEDDITDLADLPKLRNGDSHPDAPPRRPLVASMDLPVLDLAEMPEALAGVEEEPIEPAPVIEASAATASHEVTAEPAPESSVAVEHQPTLAEMVAQLEAAVSERQKQLAELESVATELAASRVAVPQPAPETRSQPDMAIPDESTAVVAPPRAERPPLEAVPLPSVKDDDIDSALAAALATLHRMNATGR